MNSANYYNTIRQFPRAAITEPHNREAYNTRNPFRDDWNLEMEKQDVGRVVLSLKVLGEKASLPLPVSSVAGYPW